MKRLAFCGVALVALTASGWSHASPLNILELCGDFELLKHPENQIYRGEFKSKGVTLETALVVTPVESSNVNVVFYLWALGGAAEVEDFGSGLRSRVGRLEGRHFVGDHTPRQE